MKYIHEIKFGEITVVENSHYDWAVLNENGEEIVPWGKYQWIEGYDNGLSRVFTNVKNDDTWIKKWGIINETGVEVLPVEYDNVWNFYHKNRITTTVEKDGIQSWVNLNDLRSEGENGGEDDNNGDDDGGNNGGEGNNGDENNNGYDDNERYNRYDNGWGYDPRDIDDAFEGDSDAYWNID